jgi:GT2 family glycosyltransferase
MTPSAVAIVNYNTREHLRACLATVQSEAPSQTVVVDNASSDGSAEMVRAEYPWVTLHANQTNRGYGAAANQAIASCTAQYVLLLNSDTLLQPGALQALSIHLDLYPRAAVVGPRLENVDGTLQASCYPFPGTLQWLLDNDTLAQLMRHVPILRNHLLRTWPHTQVRVVPAVKGAALAIRCEAFEAVGGFDESFFLFFEELDLCSRLITAGWQVHFAPVTTVMHVGGASTKQYSTAMAVQFFTGLIQFLHKHYSGIRLAGSVTIAKSVELIRLIHKTVCFRVTRDVCKRASIAEDIMARKCMLFGHRRELVP